MTIRAARRDEAAALSALALRSKAHWGYSDAFMVACRDELRVTAEQLEQVAAPCFVAETGNTIQGYCALVPVAAKQYELEALFVEPDCIGHGVGRALVEHAIDWLRAHAATALIIQGDPHARNFYLKIGAREIGTRLSDSIPGRELPLFEISLGC